MEKEEERKGGEGEGIGGRDEPPCYNPGSAPAYSHDVEVTDVKQWI